MGIQKIFSHKFNALNASALANAEIILRVTMIVILLTAGTSKFFSNGNFFNYYSELFQGDLRINLPSAVIDLYLSIIPYIEVGLGIALICGHLKPYTIYAWFGFFLSLLVGHYILEEWQSVNQILDYIFLGIFCLILPTHNQMLIFKQFQKNRSKMLTSLK